MNLVLRYVTGREKTLAMGKFLENDGNYYNYNQIPVKLIYVRNTSGHPFYYQTKPFEHGEVLVMYEQDVTTMLGIFSEDYLTVLGEVS